MRLLHNSFARRLTLIGGLLFALIRLTPSACSARVQKSPPAAQLPTQPVLRIEKGMHTAVII